MTSNITEMVIHGESTEVLKGLEDSSVDSVVCDPPYGLSKEPDIVKVLTEWSTGDDSFVPDGKGFMSKEWDGFVPPPSLWREVYRVLKPGGHALVFAGTRTQDLMTISLRLAGFEVRDVIEWLYFCLSDDTQALTRDGWKTYKELTKDDYVMQWDSETGEMSWVKPEAIHIFPYEGKMLNFKSRATDQLVTPNHRMYVNVKKHSRNEYAGKYEVFEAKDLKRHWHKRLPLAGTYEGDKTIGINRAKLLGWFLTDSWIHGDGKAVMFSQSKPETLAKLRKVLDEADVSYSEYTKEPKKDTHNTEHTFYVTGKDTDWLLEYYGDRRFNNNLLDLVIDERKALLEALIDGDGSRDEGGLLTFWSKDEEFRNFVRQLMFTLNMRTSVDNNKGCVRGSTRFNNTELQYKHGIHEIDYKGDVWCVTVPKGAFVVKRNEHVFTTGNSGFPKSHDVSKAFDRRAGAEREKVGEYTISGTVDIQGGNYNSGKTSTKTIDITAPATELAKRYSGWGTALKPAHEPIIVVRKPLIDADTGRKLTVADCVEKYGTGAINIDASRVALGDEKPPTGSLRKDASIYSMKSDTNNAGKNFTPKEGRFPANCITLDPDEFYSKYFNVANITPQELSKKASKKDRNSDWEKNSIQEDVITWESVEMTDELEELNRLRKVISEDITQGTESSEWSTLLFGRSITEEKSQTDTRSTISTELSTTTESKTCDLLTHLLTSDYIPDVIRTIEASGSSLVENAENISRLKQSSTNEKTAYRLGVAHAVLKTLLKIKEKGKRGNVHSTVKPTDLMAWLVRLVTPKGGTVFDPFAGSGSTLVAAKREGFGFIGVELTEEYIPIIEARVGAKATGTKAEANEGKAKQ